MCGFGKNFKVAAAVSCALVAGGCPTAMADPSGGDKAPKRNAISQQLVIILGGDLGLGGSNQPVSRRGGYRHGSAKSWSELTSGIAPLINGDINFANLETVVTDSNRLQPAAKAFNFKMHSAGLRHLVDIGFNALSTANNHAVDYGQTGMRHTLRHIARLRPAGLQAAPGIGIGRAAAARPAVIQSKGYKVAISALGIGGAGTRSSKTIGQMSYRSKADFAEAVDGLKNKPADFRILSVHYGAELQVRPASSAVAKLRDHAVRQANSRHRCWSPRPCRSRQSKRIDGRLVFYGMGNLLHLGMQDMAKFGHCRDFGLLAKVHITRDGANGRVRARAVEVIPLTNMHSAAKPVTPSSAAAKRLAVLNTLARELDDTTSGARGLRFVASSDGTRP